MLLSLMCKGKNLLQLKLFKKYITVFLEGGIAPNLYISKKNL